MTLATHALTRAARRASPLGSALVVAIALLVGLTLPSRAADSAAAQQFVQTVSNQAAQILRQKDRPLDQRVSALHSLMQRNVDLPRVARFTLGRYWRTASQQQQREFQHLFETYMVQMYSARLDQYSGETVNVTGATPESEDQIVVHSEINRPSNPQPLKVDWRVRQDASGLKLIDIVVEGASMAITQRQEFASVIDNNGGQVEALLAQMRERINQPPA